MADESKKQKDIYLGKDFGDAAIRVNGALLLVSKDGNLVVYTQGNVTVYTDGAVQWKPAPARVANDSAGKGAGTLRKIGDVMPDGTIYAGESPDTGKAMYVAPADAPLTCTFNKAGEYATDLNKQKAHGHDDWRVPTKWELNELFENRAAIGGFNETGACDGPNEAGSKAAGWYWSSTPYDENVWAQRFTSEGCRHGINMGLNVSLRCVR